MVIYVILNYTNRTHFTCVSNISLKKKKIKVEQVYKKIILKMLSPYLNFSHLQINPPNYASEIPFPYPKSC